MSELQRFLETGFDTFRAMNGAREFVATVRAREQAFAAALFAADAAEVARDGVAAGALTALS